MNKLIIKTFGITTAIVLSILVIVFTLMSLIYPIKVAKVFNFLGWQSVEIKYIEKSFEKDNNINELASIVELSIISKKDEKVKTYLKTLILHNEFIPYCKFKNGSLNIDSPYSKLVFYLDFVDENYSASEKNEIISTLTLRNDENSKIILGILNNNQNS